MNNVNLNYSSSKPNFGMALRMDEGKIAKKIGRLAADEAKKARPVLENLAKDVDVFVQPYVGHNGGCKLLEVYVQDLTPPIVKSKNPIVNFLREIKRQRQINIKPCASGEVFVNRDGVGRRLYAETEKQKRIFLQSK